MHCQQNEACAFGRRPLIVIGKGAAQSHADSLIRQLVDKVQISVLSTSMGRGVVPDDHALSVIAARSLALSKADVVLVMGARYTSARLVCCLAFSFGLDVSRRGPSAWLCPCRLNWQLHFGEAPKWSSSVKFILADVAPGERDVGKAALSLTGDAGAIAAQLTEALPASQGFDAARFQPWRQQLAEKVPWWHCTAFTHCVPYLSACASVRPSICHLSVCLPTHPPNPSQGPVPCFQGMLVGIMSQPEVVSSKNFICGCCGRGWHALLGI